MANTTIPIAMPYVAPKSTHMNPSKSKTFPIKIMTKDNGISRFDPIYNVLR